MEYRAGERIRIIRQMLGVSVHEFAEMMDIDVIRLKNIEYTRAKVTEVEYQKLGVRLPPLIPWLVYEGKISLSELKQSEVSLLHVIAAKLEGRLFPKGYDLSTAITS